jgi:hypothetical protein
MLASSGDHFGVMRGLDIDNLETLTKEEVDAHLVNTWAPRGVLYDMYASSLMLDYGDPAFIKMHTRAYTVTESFLDMPARAKAATRASLTLSSYVKLGYETGIRNQVNVLRQFGIPKEQSMEIVLFTQLYAGMRGLGHTYHAVGDFLPAFSPPSVPQELPPGWEVDPAAFKAGLDYSVREMTGNDAEKLTGWYEQNVGYLPESIRFGLKRHPVFVKANRGKWEEAIRTLPKQFAPWIMIRQNMMSADVDGLRESVLLGKNWGITREMTISGISSAVMYFTGFEGYYTAFKAVDDILENWDGKVQ